MKTFKEELKEKALQAYQSGKEIEEEKQKDNIELLGNSLVGFIRRTMLKNIPEVIYNKKISCFADVINIKMKEKGKFYFDIGIPSRKNYYFENVKVMGKYLIAIMLDLGIPESSCNILINDTIPENGGIVASTEIRLELNLY